MSRLRKQLPGLLAIVAIVATFLVARQPEPSAAETTSLAGGHKFTAMSIEMPSGFRQQEIRKVNKDYKHIDAWISSVGAAIAMNDLDGDGLSNDLCITDPRIDQVVVSPAPGKSAGRYSSFALSTGSPPMNPYIAPMGCMPGDFNEDGRTDLMVYYWGRTPILFLARADADAIAQRTYVPTELVPGKNTGTYDGPQWNSNAVAYDEQDERDAGQLYGIFLATATVCLIRGMYLWDLHFANKAREQHELTLRAAGALPDAGQLPVPATNATARSSHDNKVVRT